MATTVIAFKVDDCVAVLDALNIKQMPRIWSLGEMMVILRSGLAGKTVSPLQDAGISFNYASYARSDSMSPVSAGQVRYGHDGTELVLNLVPDVQLAAVYNRHLPGENALDDIVRLRVCYVCCGQDSWQNREAHGQMHKMRLLLT